MQLPGRPLANAGAAVIPVSLSVHALSPGPQAAAAAALGPAAAAASAAASAAAAATAAATAAAGRRKLPRAERERLLLTALQQWLDDYAGAFAARKARAAGGGGDGKGLVGRG